MGEFFDLSRFFDIIPKMLPYLRVTFGMVIVSMVIGTVLAILLAVIRLKNILVIQQITGIFVSFMRGTPMVVQMMISYYGLPWLIEALFDVNTNRWDKVIFLNITFILNETAFLGEAFRGAILSIPAIQTEAGYSIGMTKLQTFMRIVLPQTLKVIIPTYGIELIGLFHSTSLGYMIGVIELMGRAKTLGNAIGHTLETYLFAALVYIVISVIMKGLFTLINRKIQYGRRYGNVV